MSDYPEHDKLQKVQGETQAAGEFADWLQSQGIQLMTWREDLTDERETNPECKVSFDSDNPQSCDQTRALDDDDYPRAWWRRHCFHWQDPQREAVALSQPGYCCRCKRGHFHTIHGVKAWTSPGKDLLALLAEWSGIDQGKLEDEKRQILEKARAANNGG